MVAQHLYQFRLDGVDYTLRGNMKKERMEQIVDAVETKILSIRKKYPYYSQTRAATLAAIQLSEELLEIKDEYAAFAGETDVVDETLF